jgi:hypothetical protein
MTVLVARTGHVMVAPKGTPLPTSPTAPVNAAFKRLGKLNSPGITVTPTTNTSTSNFWEDNEEFVISNGDTWDISFEMNDWNENTINLYFNPVELNTTEGSFVIGGNSQDVEVVLFIVFSSGEKSKAIIAPNFKITERSALNLISTDKLALPIGGRCQKDEEINGYIKVLDPELVGIG